MLHHISRIPEEDIKGISSVLEGSRGADHGKARIFPTRGPIVPEVSVHTPNKGIGAAGGANIAAAVVQFSQNNIYNGIMGDHMSRCCLIDLQTKDPCAKVVHDQADLSFIIPHGLDVGHSRRYGVMKGFTEAAIV